MHSKTPEWFQKALKQKPKSHYHKGKNYAIHYLFWPCQQKATGSLFLLHGSFAHAHWYDFIAPLLSDLYDVYAIDLPGMGDSDWQETYPIKTIAQDILNISHNVSLPIYSIGHSFGGLVSLVSGLYFSQQLAGIICVDFSIRPPKERLTWLDQAKGLSDIKHQLHPKKDDLKKRFRLLPEQPCENTFIMDHIAEHSICSVDKNHSRIHGNNGFYRWKFDPMFYKRVEINRDKLEEINTVSCPVSFIFGGRSWLDKPEYKDYIKQLDPTIPISVIPHAYHHVFLDQPLAFVSTVRNQLANWLVS